MNTTLTRNHQAPAIPAASVEGAEPSGRTREHVRPVMVPLDGSALAENALTWAAAIATQRGAPLILVRVIEPLLYSTELSPYPGPMPDAFSPSIDAEVDQARSYLASVRANLHTQWPRLSIVTEVLIGHPATCLLEAEDHYDVQLVVMTSHGRSGLERWVRGSVAEKLLRSGTVPVFLIRPRDELRKAVSRKSGVRVLVPLDGSALATQAIPEAMRFAADRDGELILITVLNPLYQPLMGPSEGWRTTAREAAFEHLHAIAKQVKAQGVRVSRAVLTAEDVAGAIVDQAILESADVIVMSTHGRGSLGRWIYGSVADRVAQAARVPVVLVRPQPAAQGPAAVPQNGTAASRTAA